MVVISQDRICTFISCKSLFCIKKSCRKGVDVSVQFVSTAARRGVTELELLSGQVFAHRTETDESNYSGRQTALLQQDEQELRDE